MELSIHEAAKRLGETFPYAWRGQLAEETYGGRVVRFLDEGTLEGTVTGDKEGFHVLSQDAKGDVTVRFKSPADAFRVFTGQIGVAQAQSPALLRKKAQGQAHIDAHEDVGRQLEAVQLADGGRYAHWGGCSQAVAQPALHLEVVAWGGSMRG